MLNAQRRDASRNILRDDNGSYRFPGAERISPILVIVQFIDRIALRLVWLPNRIVAVVPIFATYVALILCYTWALERMLLQVSRADPTR